MAPPAGGQDAIADADFSPFKSVSYLRGFDLHMRGVCVEPNMPYKLYGLTRESCGGPDFKFDTRNASKGRVQGCDVNEGLTRAVCKQTGLYCDKVSDPHTGLAYEPTKLLFIHRAALVPMEFWDQNFGHIITDGAMAVAARRGVQTGATSRTRASASGRVSALTDASPLYLWRDRGKPFAGQALDALWRSNMYADGLRYLPHSGGIVCFDSAVILSQPLNMLSWQRLASIPFLRMAESWQTSARLIQWPEGDARAATALEPDSAQAVAAAIAARGDDPGLGPLPRASVVSEARALRRRMTAAAPPQLLQGPKCGLGAGQRRRPKIMAINRTGKRRVRNMDALIQWFNSKGYEAVTWDPSGAPGQQAAEVQSADIFLSNHGQAQAWAMFMREDAAMITVCSDNQLRLGSCTYYGIAARNGGHSPRRIFKHTSANAQFHAGQKLTDDQMHGVLDQHGGQVAGEWHYKNTHWDDIEVDLPAFQKAWADHLGAEDPDAEAFWNWWCQFDDVVKAIDNADGESLPTEDAGTWMATRLPRLEDGIMHI